MKTLLYFAAFLAVAMFTAMPASAQMKLNMGFKLGLNNSTYDGDAPTNVAYSSAFAGGLVGELSVKKSDSESKKFYRLSFIAEADYLPQGASYSIGSVDYTDKLTYLHVPVMARMYWGLLGSLKTGFYANAGPYYSYLLKGETEGNGETVDISDNIESNDFGVALGGGFAIGGVVFVDLRYNMGLADIAPGGDANTSNKGWGIFGAVAIPLNK